MFESAELDHRIDKETWEREEPSLRQALLEAQFELQQRAWFSVVLIVSGMEGSGKGQTVNQLNAWMDPRHVETNALDLPTDEERARPPMWRFWRALPPRGSIGVFFGSWYTGPLLRTALGKGENPDLERRIDEIRRFEKMLVEEGTLILKFWFHLSKKQQRKRFEELEDDENTRWRVTKHDWKAHKKYDEIRSVAEYLLRRTNSAYAPWVVIEGRDEHYRNLSFGRTLLRSLEARLEVGATPRIATPAPPLPELDERNVINTLDLSHRLERKEYKEALAEEQGRLGRLSRRDAFGRIGVVAVFEGMDAAGKGGAIRRATAGLDARFYRVIRVSAPTEEERAHPYLWRFWRRIPRVGRFTFFDRSWYGRVLVERVEGFADAPDWMRAYNEINDFEAELCRYGIIVVKFWLALSREEQLRRFEDRRNTGFKRYKITDEDWRNRDKWGEYVVAASQMIERTSTGIAPWTLVESEDKRWARVKVLRTLCDRIEERL